MQITPLQFNHQSAPTAIVINNNDDTMDINDMIAGGRLNAIQSDDFSSELIT